MMKKKKYNIVDNDINTIREVRAFITDGYVDEAKDLLNEYFGIYSTNLYANIEYAKILYIEKKYEEAIEILKELKDLPNLKENDKSYINFTLGNAYHKYGDLDNAIKYYLTSIKDKGNYKKYAYYLIHTIYKQKGNMDEAEKYAKKTIEYKSKNNYSKDILLEQKARISLSRMYVSSGSYSDLRKAEKIISEIDDKVLSTKNNRKFYLMYLTDVGIINYKFKRYKNSLEIFNKSKIVCDKLLGNNVENERKKIVINYYIGLINITQGDLDGAMVIFKDLLNNEYIEPYKKKEVELSIARVLMYQSKLDKAESLLNRLKENNEIFPGVADSFLIDIQILRKNYDLAKEMIIEKGDDLESLFKYMNISIHETNFDKARCIFEKIKFICNKNSYINKEFSIRIKKAETFLNNIDKKETDDFDIYSTQYLANQIRNYKEEDAIEHIKRHYDSDKDYNNFNKEIDINELFIYMKNNLSEENFIINKMLDVYLIPYENVGHNNNSSLNHISVNVLPGTKNIITAYPSGKYITYEERDNDEEVEEINNDKPKVKRMSQIEKFNQKYGNNSVNNF